MIETNGIIREGNDLVVPIEQNVDVVITEKPGNYGTKRVASFEGIELESSRFTPEFIGQRLRGYAVLYDASLRQALRDEAAKRLKELEEATTFGKEIRDAVLPEIPDPEIVAYLMKLPAAVLRNVGRALSEVEGVSFYLERYQKSQQEAAEAPQEPF